MFNIPVEGSNARQLIDLPSVVEILNPANASKLLSTLQARKVAERMFEADKAIKRVCLIVIRAENDQRWLISFGRRGGWKKEWNFGNGR